MNERPGWAVSTGEGVALDADDFVGLLAVHHRRLLDTWRGFTPTQWNHPTRNADWTVHQTVRHVADGMERCAAAVCGDPVLDKLKDFDPRTTPDEWLARSDDETTEGTIERFEAASTRLRTGTGDRLASGDDSHARTVYGSAHWSVNVAHVLWDSWLHERDVLLPLGQPAETSAEEERFVALYGLLMSLVPSVMSERPLAVTVRLTGLASRVIEVRCDSGSIVSAEVAEDEAAITGSTSAAIDALAGRGVAVNDALPGAPAELGFLAAFLNS